MRWPPRLRAWARQLDMFPDDLAPVMGEMVVRLAAAVGPLSVASGAGTGEPDGLDGIARRGPWGRLLLSEWALADVVPEEFLRRAAAGEQSFLRLRRVAPVAGRRTVVLVDAGPDQLGAPRLVQAAALLAFARRAVVAGAELAWGALQQRGLHEGVSDQTLGHLRLARTSAPVSAADVAWWTAKLAARGPASDLWIVGGPAAVGCGLSPRTVEVVDPLDVGGARLDVRVQTPLRSAGVSLQVPDDDTCVRLFRFAIRPPPRAQLATRPGLFAVVPGGNRLIVSLENGGYGAFHIPNSTNVKQPGHTRVWVPEGRAVAVGFYRRGFRHVMVDGAQLRLWSGVRTPIPPGFVIPERPRLCVVGWWGGSQCLFVHAGDDALWALDLDRGYTWAQVAEAVNWFDVDVAYRLRDGGAERLKLLGPWTWEPIPGCTPDLGPVTDVLSSPRPALWLGDHQWVVVDEGQVFPVAVHPTEEVHGVVPFGTATGSGPGVGVVCLGRGRDAGRIRIAMCAGEGEGEVIVRAAEPVVSVSVSGANGDALIAWRTRSGRIGVWSRWGGGVVLDVAPGAAS